MAIAAIAEDRGWLAQFASAITGQIRRIKGWWLLTILIAAMVCLPLLQLVLGSFSTDDLPSSLIPQHLGTDSYRTVYTDPKLYETALNTVIYVGLTALLTTGIALLLAYLIERTDMRARSAVYALILAAMMVPGILSAVSWELLLNPNSGLINALLRHIWAPLASVGINNIGGMVFVQSIHSVPVAVLLLSPVMRNLDPSLEEAAMTSGAGFLQRTWQVTAKLLFPGVMAVFIYEGLSALDVFEVPAILGMPSNTYVFSTYLYDLVHSASHLPAYNLAGAAGVLVLACAAVAVVLYRRVLTNASRYATVSGKGFRARRQKLGKWRPVMLAICLVYGFIAVILPFLEMAYSSLSPYLRAPSLHPILHPDFSSYKLGGIGYPIGATIVRTLELSLTAATAATLLALAVSYVVMRTKFRGRQALDILAFSPHAIPGVLVALAGFLAFAEIGGPLFDTIWSVVIAFVVITIAFTTRTLNAALAQIHTELEEAVQVSGFTRVRAVRSVIVPLILPAVAAAWLFVFVLVVRVAGVPLILLPTSGTPVLSVYLWQLWFSGHLPECAALGVMLTVLFFVLMGGSRVLQSRAAVASSH